MPQQPEENQLYSDVIFQNSLKANCVLSEII